MVISLTLVILIIILPTGLFLLRFFNSDRKKGPVENQTPCCIDRLSAISCQRLQLFNPSLFLYNCVHNADFAFVQCCSSCQISENLLTNPLSATCYDRRGEEWCKKLLLRYNYYKKLSCKSMPFSFRVCRKSCGYCSTPNRKASVIYNFNAAMDRRRCSNLNQAFAIELKLTELHLLQKEGEHDWN
ncbi:unnamed protein product [Enterobius vermicularis]|uniref:ShKT domain-containing protein n=1 Tax=Enterobius vermicularis TaxID=51028 RepID=A0A0N4UZP2_ENTVE|nr:unnamed protein product [Enterobius vermicularis]